MDRQLHDSVRDGLGNTLFFMIAIPFAMAGSGYLLALIVIHALTPRLEPAKIT